MEKTWKDKRKQGEKYMYLLIEIIKFLIYSIVIVVISKYALVRILRKLGKLLKLKSKVIGNIAGIATSIPELLTVSFSALTGLIETSVYNIISSNVINLIQYSATVILNKNQKVLKNKAIRIDLFLVGITIIIPIIMLVFNFESQFIIVPIFIVLLLIFYKITNNAHKLYMKKNNNEEVVKSNVKENTEENNIRKDMLMVVIQIIFLIIIGLILYVVGNLLSDVLNNLCVRFDIPELIIGVLLGFITSLPELITFFEAQKHHTDDKEGVVEATSNLLTSNVMNLFVIQSVGIMIYFIVK